MIIRKVQAELETEVCFSTAPALGNETTTVGHIPGTALRGMLAARYLQTQAADETFRRLFIDGAIQFPDLYPGSTNTGPLPRSAYTCKQFPGFLGDEPPTGDEAAHGVVDMLVAAAAGKKPDACPSCKAPLVPLSSSYYGGSEGRPHSDNPRTTLAMRTSVEGRNGSARAASLHSQQELAGGQSFEGFIRAADKADLEALFNVVGEKAVVFGGRRRAGKISLSFGSVDQIPEAPNPFSVADQPHQRFVALTLLSDTILVDQLLRPVVTLDGHQVSELLQPPADVDLRVAFAGERRVAGWHSVGQLFKQDDIAISSGSTFLLALKPENEETLTEWMVNLTRNGIGLRRSEGFGRVTFSALLHRAASTRKSGTML